MAALLASLLRDQGWAELRDGRPLQLRPSPFNRMLVVAGTFSASFECMGVWEVLFGENGSNKTEM